MWYTSLRTVVLLLLFTIGAGGAPMAARYCRAALCHGIEVRRLLPWLGAAAALALSHATGSLAKVGLPGTMPMVLCVVAGAVYAWLSAVVALQVTLRQTATRPPSWLPGRHLRAGSRGGWQMVYGLVFSVCVEEMLWRGGLQALLPPGWLSAVAVAALFSVWHRCTRSRMESWIHIHLFLLGVLLGGAMYLWQNLLYPAALHLTHNAILDYRAFSLQRSARRAIRRAARRPGEVLASDTQSEVSRGAS